MFWAAKETFVQLNIEYGLLENAIFDFQCTNGIMTSFDDGGAFACERKENAQLSAIFGGGRQLKRRFSNFPPRFRKH